MEELRAAGNSGVSEAVGQLERRLTTHRHGSRERHLFPDLGRWVAGLQQRAAGQWADVRLLRRHAAIDHQFRARDPG